MGKLDCKLMTKKLKCDTDMLGSNGAIFLINLIYQKYDIFLNV